MIDLKGRILTQGQYTPMDAACHKIGQFRALHLKQIRVLDGLILQPEMKPSKMSPTQDNKYRKR